MTADFISGIGVGAMSCLLSSVFMAVVLIIMAKRAR